MRGVQAARAYTVAQLTTEQDTRRANVTVFAARLSLEHPAWDASQVCNVQITAVKAHPRGRRTVVAVGLQERLQLGRQIAELVPVPVGPPLRGRPAMRRTSIRVKVLLDFHAENVPSSIA